jgi:hypothetical protein
VCATEVTTTDEIDRFARALEAELAGGGRLDDRETAGRPGAAAPAEVR